MDATYVVEFVDQNESTIGDEEVFTRSGMLTLIDSVRTRIMYDDDLRHDCNGLNIRRVGRVHSGS